METLTLNVLGPVQVLIDDEEIGDFRTNKVQALLIYLALEPDAHRRESLMELLWPGMPERSARLNLRQILHLLRNILSDLPFVDEAGEASVSFVVANRQTIQRNPAASVTIDSERFDELIDSTISHEHPDLFICHHCRKRLEEAVVLYRDNFLADFYLDDSNAFEHWAQVKREVYARRTLDALETLSTIYTREKKFSRARTLIDRQLQIDDLREGAYRQMMQLLALAGRREEALRVYEKCRRILVDELGMEPSKRTTELYEQILAGELSFDTPVARGVRGYELKEEIGRGAAGAIHRAVQPAIKREVAVKVIRRRYANDPEFIRRFEAEAQTIAHLEHPHIVPLYDYWRDPDGAYLVMRYLKGGSLLSSLELGPWNPEPAVKMLDQVCAALSVAHRHGVVHRDIKPANILLDEDINAFLADFGIAKGLGRQEQMTAAGVVIGTPDYISPEQIRNDNVSPQTDIYSLGAVLYETLTGEKPFPDASVANLIYKHLNEPVPLVATSRSDLPPQIDDVIRRATAKRPSDRYADALEMAEAFRVAVQGGDGAIVISGIPETIPEINVYNPYKGLRAFQEADSDDFFGREAFVDQLVRHLSDSRFLALVGPSGSGKSSAVKAGLIPVLRSGAILPKDNVAGSKKWFVAEMVPGTHPLEELELALWPVAVDPPPSLVGPMERDTRGLLRTIRRILPDEEGAQLLLVIDQFEELFTLVEDEERRAFFIDSLLQAIAAPRSPLRVVITLRADFYDRPLQIDTLGALLRDHTEVVLPLSTDELTWAIREPARRMRIGLEQGLIEAIIADVAEQSGSLPLLQYTLTELFDRRQDRLMTRLAYQEMGGLRGMLGRRADAIYGELEPAGQGAARQLFLRLVTLGEGVEDTRRRVLRSELEAIEREEQPMADDGQQAPAPISTVIDKFGEARLLTFDRDPKSRQPTVEVAHEALLREWNQLSNWLDNSRADIRNQRQLDQATRAWLGADKDGSYLLRGSRLSFFADWATRSAVALTSEERTFLEANLAARRARQESEAARQQQELETAQRLAETERARAEEQAESARTLRRRAAFLAGALVMAGLLTVAAFFFARQSNQNAVVAQENADLAATREIDALAEAEQRATVQVLAEQKQQLADEQAIAALEAQQQAEAEADLRAEAQTKAERAADVAFSRELAAAAHSTIGDDPERSILLALEALTITETVAAENALHRAILTSRLRRRFDIPGDNRAYYLAQSPDGGLIFSSGENGGELWNVDSGQVQYSRDINGYINQAAFSPDGDLLLLPYEDFDNPDQGMVTILEAETGWELVSLEAHDNFVSYIAFSPDGERFATGSGDGTVRIWDLAATLENGADKLVSTLPGNGGPIWAVAYNQEGSLLAAANQNGTATVWDAMSGQELLNVEIGPGGRVVILDLFFTPDGRYFVSSGGDQSVSIWDLSSGQRVATTVSPTINQDLKMSPDGELVVTAGVDGTARVWRFTTEGLQEVMALSGHSSRLRSAEFGPDGSYIISSGRDNTIRIWDISAHGNEELPMLPGPGGRLMGLALNAEGTRLASGTDDGSAVIWDAVDGHELHTLSGHADAINSVDFSPDGRLLATASEDTTVSLWDANTGQKLATLEGHVKGNIGNVFEGVLDVDFSPDGTRLVTAGADGIAKVWDVESGEELLSFKGRSEGDGLTQATFSPDGALLAISTDEAAGDAVVKLFEVATGQELYTIGSLDRVWSIGFSPQGDSLGIVDRNGIVSMWALPQVNSGSGELESEAEELFRVVAHSGPAAGLSFTPAGDRLVTAGAGNLTLRDAWTGEQLLTIDGPFDFETTVFAPDGKWLAATGSDGNVHVYAIDLELLLSLARSRVTRQLTDGECQQYLHVAECPAKP